MTYREDFTLPPEMLAQIASQGFDVLPELNRMVMNAAMQAEREQYLKAAPYQHTSERQGYANGFKPKTVQTRVGAITFDIPQVREGGFYPQALEKGWRSERARVLALAEMYVQGGSTRKVKAITEQLCGLEISSDQVSRAASLLDGNEPMPVTSRSYTGASSQGRSVSIVSVFESTSRWVLSHWDSPRIEEPKRVRMFLNSAASRQA